MKENRQYGLVLGGGGARGAYQLGAWKALNAIGIPIVAVTGASIGSINGALFAQGDLHLAERAWHRLNLQEVIQFEEALPAPDNLFDIRNINPLIRNYVTSKGLDMEPIRKLLCEYIDEDKVRRSPVDLGIITYDLTSRKPVEIFKADMPAGSLVDYILASACFPVFRSVEIDSQRFIDGGIYNNLPTGMLAARGIRDIIEVDIGGIEFVRPPREKDLRIITIRPAKPLGGVLDMTPSVLRSSMRRGMFDTYRAFGRLTGKTYYLTVRSTQRFVKQYGQNVLDGLETAAERYSVNPLHIYSPEKLFAAVEQKFQEDSQKYISLRCRDRDKLFERIRGSRPRLNKIEKDFLIPAAVEVLGDPDANTRTRELVHRLMPSAAICAEALITLGVRLAPVCEVP